jgi:hypothetical protein
MLTVVGKDIIDTESVFTSTSDQIENYFILNLLAS